ncbi:hypothetical protein B0H34DRAFT_728549 [Crassisporium funariophilum]|nr:hypothetical protein B0H34DRAFT_728549 [Crassisporium funariophilum]
MSLLTKEEHQTIIFALLGQLKQECTTYTTICGPEVEESGRPIASIAETLDSLPQSPDELSTFCGSRELRKRKEPLVTKTVHSELSASPLVIDAEGESFDTTHQVAEGRFSEANITSITSRPSWNRFSIARAPHPSFSTVLTDVNGLSTSPSGSVTVNGPIETPVLAAFVDDNDNKPVATFLGTSATVSLAPADATNAEFVTASSSAVHADTITASAAALACPSEVFDADTNVPLHVAHPSGAHFDPMMDTPTLSQSEIIEDQFGAGWFDGCEGSPALPSAPPSSPRSPSPFPAVPDLIPSRRPRRHIEGRSKNNVIGLEHGTQQVSQTQTHVHAHLWGYLRPITRSLPRVEFRLDQPTYTIGRQAERNHVIFPGVKMSKVHCRLTWHGGEEVLIHDHSSNGTFINGDMVGKGGVRLVRDGDIIAFCTPVPQPISNSVEDYRFIYRHVAGRFPPGLPAGISAKDENNEDTHNLDVTKKVHFATPAFILAPPAPGNINNIGNTTSQHPGRGNKRLRDSHEDDMDVSRPFKRQNNTNLLPGPKPTQLPHLPEGHKRIRDSEEETVA